MQCTTCNTCTHVDNNNYYKDNLLLCYCIPGMGNPLRMTLYKAYILRFYKYCEIACTYSLRVNHLRSTVEQHLLYNGQAPRSQMNSLCTKQPLKKGRLCIKAKTL